MSNDVKFLISESGTIYMTGNSIWNRVVVEAAKYCKCSHGDWYLLLEDMCEEHRARCTLAIMDASMGA